VFRHVALALKAGLFAQCSGALGELVYVLAGACKSRIRLRPRGENNIYKRLGRSM